jgi:hypothetical protein
MRRLGALTASAAMAAAGLLASVGLAGPASAAGAHAQYQVSFALNCNNPSAPCQQIFGLGGIWGSIALSSNRTATAQVTECGHTVGGGGPGLAGAEHLAFTTTWSMFPSPVPPSPITPADPNNEYLVC